MKGNHDHGNEIPAAILLRFPLPPYSLSVS